MGEALKEAPQEMTINVNNLARESIAMAIRESVASLPKVQTTAVAEKLPVPAQKPVSSKSTPTKQTSVPKTTVSPVAMKMVQDVAGEPPQGEPMPALKPFRPGGENIKMETPPGNNPGAAASTSGDESDGIPRPVFKTAPRPQEMPRIKMDSVPIETDITQIEDPNVIIAEKNNTGPPSVEQAMTQSNRITDTPDGKDAADQVMLAASAPPVKTMTGSLGTLLFDPHIVMEESKRREMRESPELGMLLKDPNITKALKLSMLNDKAAGKKLKDRIEVFIKKHKLKFNSFEVVKFLLAEKKLRPVDKMVYQNMPGLSLPVDTELEVPERYNR